MKKLFRFIGLSGTAFAMSLALGMNLSNAYYEEHIAKTIATVTVNGEPADVQAEMIDGKLYFSLRDYWENILHTHEEIQWFPRSQVLINHDTGEMLLLKDQTLRDSDGNFGSLTDPVILQDGRLMAAFSYLEDAREPSIYRYKTHVPQLSGNTLDFRTTLWERWNNGALYDTICLPPESIALNPETGLPDWANSNIERFRNESRNTLWNFDREDLVVTQSETADGTLSFEYRLKELPEKKLLVAVRDGYVRKIEDCNFLNAEFCY